MVPAARFRSASVGAEGRDGEGAVDGKKKGQGNLRIKHSLSISNAHQRKDRQNRRPQSPIPDSWLEGLSMDRSSYHLLRKNYEMTKQEARAVFFARHIAPIFPLLTISPRISVIILNTQSVHISLYIAFIPKNASISHWKARDFPIVFQERSLPWKNTSGRPRLELRWQRQ